MDKEKKGKREKEDQDDDDDDDDDSWRRKFQSLAATTATATNKSNNKGNRRINKQENDQETDETSSTSAAADDSESVPDLDLAATPMSSWSSASTSPLLLSPALSSRRQRQTNNSSTATNVNSNKKSSSLTQDRHDVRQQATLALVLMASSTALVIWTLLPIASIAAILVWMASLTVTIQVAYRALLLEYQYMLQHDGLRPYLPSSIYQQLTQTTLHEYMTDPTFGLEYRHLLLYFLPLSPQQLEYYLHRLAPRHQQDLRRPGLGFWLLGNDVMRHVVGEPTFQQLQQQQHQQENRDGDNNNVRAEPSIMTPPSQQPSGSRPRQLLILQDTTTSSGETSVNSHNQSLDFNRVMEGQDDDDNNNIDDDDASDLGLEITEADQPGGMLTERQASGMVQWLGLMSPERSIRAEPNSTTNTSSTATTVVTATPTSAPSSESPQLQQPQQDPDEQRALVQEGQVIYDAFYSLFTDYSSMAYESVGQVVVDMVDATTPSVIQSSLALSFLSVGVAMFGWWRGVYQFQRSSFSDTLISNQSAYYSPFTMTRTSISAAAWFPSPWLLRSTGLLGGAVASTVTLFRFSLRRALLPTTPKVPADEDHSKPESPK